MGEPKISGFIISIVVVLFMFGVHGIFISKAAVNYGVAYDNATYQKYVDNVAVIEAQSLQIKNATEQIKIDSGVTDKIGAYISVGFSTLKIAFSSLDTFLNMFTSALTDIKLGPFTALTFSLVLITVVILIVIGVFLAALINRRL